MKLKFALKPTPTSIDELTDIQIKQLEMCGKLYDGQERSAEELLAEHDDETDCGFGGFLELYDVVDEETGEVAYDAWLFMVDSGTIFKHDTLQEVACVIQFGLECEGDTELYTALEEAFEARERPPRQEGATGVWAAYAAATDAAREQASASSLMHDRGNEVIGGEEEGDL